MTMWTKTEDTHVQPELVPDHVQRYLAQYTLRACKRFYFVPENRARFEAWKAERCARKNERVFEDAIFSGDTQ